MTTSATAAPAEQVMQCMEVWGGNQITNQSVVMAGLDAWVYSRPYGQADGGGDVYYVSSCATGRITRLLVADVSGHGSAVRDVAVQLRTLMRKFVNYLDQTRFVKSMNQQFVESASNGCFATAVVTTFFGPTNRISLCNAGHPHPLLYRASTGDWQAMESTEAEAEEPRNVPLGILDICDYEQFDVELAVGDLVLCYTDSLVECHGPDGEMLGTTGLLDIVRTVDPADASTFIPRLLAAIETKFAGNLTGDDVTALLFRPNGSAPSTPLKERLLAPFRVLRSIVRSWMPGGDPAALPDLHPANMGGTVLPFLNRLWRPKQR